MAGGDKYPSSYTNSLIRKVCLSMVLDRYLFWITHPTMYSWVHNSKERQCLIIFFYRDQFFFFISKQKTHRHITSTIIAFFLNTYSQNKQSRNQKKERQKKGGKKITFLMGSFMLLLLFFHRNNVHLYNTVAIHHEFCLLLHSSIVENRKIPAIFVEYFLQKNLLFFSDFSTLCSF